MSGAATDEFALIARHFAPLARGAPLAFGLTDDAALLRPEPGFELAVTTDCMVEGVHFLLADGPGPIARKLLRVNLSDLAAMGAEPAGYLLAAAFPRGTEESWIAGFAAGLAEDQQAFGIALLGGDTVATPGPATFTVTALGRVPAGAALRRNGARPGDKLYVSGTIGDAVLGLAAKQGRLQVADAQPLLDRLHLPQPRLALGQALRGVASACLDVSDGLAQDAGHIARASGVALVIEAARVPLSPAARAAGAELGALLAGGDDYELLFAAAGALPDGLPAPVACIGRVEAGSGVRVLDAAGREMRLERAGYRHF